MRLFGIVALAAALSACSGKPPEASLARGQHLATVMGCVSCHGAKLDGHLFEENPQFVLASSSNLSRILPGWSDRQIKTALRTGVRPDGSALWFMPTFAQTHLSKEDMTALIAWLRSVPPSGTLHPRMKRGPMFAQALEHGFQDSAAQAKRLAGRTAAQAGPQHATGRYLASLSCTECHGPDLNGPKDPRPGDPPDLAIAAAYTPQAFARLLKTGIKQDGKPAGDMAEQARERLSAFDPAEVEAMQRYLVARAGVTSERAGSPRPGAPR